MSPHWTDKLQTKLIQQYGDKKGTALAKKYATSFSNSYSEDFGVDEALSDIKFIEKVTAENPLEISLYEKKNGDEKEKIYLKLFQYEKTIALSDILPILENLNLRTFTQRPYKMKFTAPIWISDFSIAYTHPEKLDIARVRENFINALININKGLCENDGFNKLILGADLPWRQVMILRAYAKYLHQIGFRFSQKAIEKTLEAYPLIAKNLINFFILKFDPTNQKPATQKLKHALEEQINKDLESVISLDEDRVLRNLLKLIQATIRTNYFKKDQTGHDKDYFSFKLMSDQVPDLPLPRPLYEVFVYSPHFEAIHLRSAKVARGGIRWSDRREDFRTEILGLMKAQKVKNAIIVPSGAKGGFVLKAVPPHATREVLQAEVIRCYKSFMSGLLDITDNLKQNKVIPPIDVVCYDDPDTYLVVAADKGTASFSDIANSISKEYDFWLGDAFASGGSAGYDHKKMGITARGAWESIRRHFHEININIFADEFTFAGVGDMSGDVFGNGTIYSDHIKLIAAFDHRDIFVDPTPDTKKSFLERVRMFNLPTSSWQDYNKKLISKGGGIFPRTSKSIPISPEMKKALDITDNSLAPNDLIRAILKAPVDLFFNGGIGTYVKAISESHADVGDKANEFCRVNGDELRCRVVGEGGNLGFTQLGRIEYALKGGLINTDFIDNSAGVDCSDHEVNLKILLNKEMILGNLTEKKRNQLLFSMTEEVGHLVLEDNYNQALAMSISVNHSAKLIGLYHTYLKELEHSGVIDRVVEFLPDDKKIMERKSAGLGLTSPELAVLLAYSKIHVKNEILRSDISKDNYLGKVLTKAFPSRLNKLYGKQLLDHPLRSEIIATQLSNQIVNVMGITFVYRLEMETGASVGEIIRAQLIAAHVFRIHEVQKAIDGTESSIPAALQHELLHYLRNLMNLATRWFLRNNRLEGDIEKIITHYSNGVKELERIIPDLMLGVTKTFLPSLEERLLKVGSTKELAIRIATSRAIYTSLNIIEVATQHNFDLIKTAKVYFNVGGRFSLVWFRDQIAADNREGHWNTLARLSLRDELDTLQRLLTLVIMQDNKKEPQAAKLINSWVNKNEQAIKRWDKLLELLYDSKTVEYSMFFIAIRELSNWVLAKT